MSQRPKPEHRGPLLLRIFALVWAGVGLAFLIRPVVLGEYVNLFLPTTTSRIHLRASHGGLALALAAFFWLAASRIPWYRPALAASLLVHGGLAIATLLGIVLEGQTIPRILVMMSVELCFALAAARALSASRAEAS